MNTTFFKIKESRFFQLLVITIIIFNAFTIGVNTYELSDFSNQVINLLDYSITIFFVVEIIIRFIGEPKKSQFFKSGWNVFDALIVCISLIPIPNNSSFLLLRLLRVFRVLRIISVVPELKMIIEALLQSVKRVFYVSLLLFIILYIYSTIGSILFSEDIPESLGKCRDSHDYFVSSFDFVLMGAGHVAYSRYLLVGLDIFLQLYHHMRDHNA